MATKVRTASVDAPMAALIDKAADMDKRHKVLGDELKTAKDKIKEDAPLEDEEISVRMEGKTHKAVVSKKTSFTVEPVNPDEFDNALSEGEFGDVVRVTLKVGVRPERFIQLRDLLQENDFTYEEEYTVDAKALDKLDDNSESATLLAGSLITKETLAVKFE